MGSFSSCPEGESGEGLAPLVPKLKTAHSLTPFPLSVVDLIKAKGVPEGWIVKTC